MISRLYPVTLTSPQEDFHAIPMEWEGINARFNYRGRRFDI